MYQMKVTGLRPASGHPWAPAPATVPFPSSAENIFCNKVSAFPDSSVGCCMENKARILNKPRYGSLPVLGLPVQVQCEGFKCMAFRDREGRWVDLFSRELLPRVLGVVSA